MTSQNPDAHPAGKSCTKHWRVLVLLLDMAVVAKKKRPPIPTEPIVTIDEFLTKVRGRKRSLANSFFLYRGQHVDKPLLPGLFRDWDRSVNRLIEIESQLFEEFKSSSTYLLPSQPSNDWDWL